jgi:hypothetical protein
MVGIQQQKTGEILPLKRTLQQGVSGRVERRRLRLSGGGIKTFKETFKRSLLWSS